MLPDHIPEVLVALITHTSSGPNKAQLLSRSQTGLTVGGVSSQMEVQGLSAGVQHWVCPPLGSQFLIDKVTC